VAEAATIRGATVKIRRPWGVFFLVLVTLGIYYLVWYYKTNRELHDYGIEVEPVVSLLAITLGGLLIIPPFVSEWRYFKRIREAQLRAGLDRPISHVIGFVLYLIAVIFLPFEAVYAQGHLNRLWRHELEEQTKEQLGMRGEPAVA
jgi:formate hydrogenlyase subunit 3/multisubunit Na+/H+ antiporter MnhD subunit